MMEGEPIAKKMIEHYKLNNIKNLDMDVGNAYFMNSKTSSIL